MFFCKEEIYVSYRPLFPFSIIDLQIITEVSAHCTLHPNSIKSCSLSSKIFHSSFSSKNMLSVYVIITIMRKKERFAYFLNAP